MFTGEKRKREIQLLKWEKGDTRATREKGK